MQVNGLTLRISPIASACPSQDRETALLKWLLAEFQREQKKFDYHADRAIIRKGELDDKDLRGQEA